MSSALASPTRCRGQMKRPTVIAGSLETVQRNVGAPRDDPYSTVRGNWAQSWTWGECSATRGSQSPHINGIFFHLMIHNNEGTRQTLQFNETP